MRLRRVSIVWLAGALFAFSICDDGAAEGQPSPASQPVPGGAQQGVQELRFLQTDGSTGMLRYPEQVEPLRPFEILLQAGDEAPYDLVLDGRTTPFRGGRLLRVSLSGEEGPRKFQIRRSGRPVADGSILLRAKTSFEGGSFTSLFDRLCETVRHDRSRSPRMRKGKAIYTNPSWVRDHIHEMKAYKYWENDLVSFVDTLIEMQHPDGFFYEILTGRRGGDADHLTFVNPKHRMEEPEDGLGWVRLEIEADVEYLMVEAAYAIWQATGDGAAMRARLPHLEKGLLYDFTDPTRWDAEHGALKRTFTIDTWDFTYGVSDQNRKIEPGMPMGIMHGDNSGLHHACRQLAQMYSAAGDPAKSRQWDQRAAGLRERVNRLCFNGRYYTHQILLQPVETGVREEDILSLSNTYDINRGLPTHEMAVRILDEYQARRKLRQATHFAEWFSIDPPYPMFFRYAAGKYINGGIASFVAGELAKAALNEGREDYGADILNRVAEKVAKDGAIYFLYTTDGKNQGGGPSGWGAAAVISALVEGLAGIRDDATLFKEVTVSPRFLAAGLNQATVCARYGPSGAYASIDYDHRPAGQTIHIRLAGVADKTRLRVLLPDGVGRAAFVEPADLSGRIETIEQSHYLVADYPVSLRQGVAEFTIRYQK
jgi:hypothetical protein